MLRSCWPVLGQSVLLPHLHHATPVLLGPARAASRRAAAPAKGPLNGWTMFLRERAPEARVTAGGRTTQVLSAEWQGMSDAEKQHYIQAAETRNTLEARAAVKAKIKTITGWNMYAREYVRRNAGQGTSPQELMKEAGPQWKKLPEHEKAPYNAAAAAAELARKEAREK